MVKRVGAILGKRISLALLLVLLFSLNIFAASVQVDLNGKYYVGGEVTVSGNILPVATDDLNIVLVNAVTGAVADQNLVTADANGAYRINYSGLLAADYNGTATDINTNATNRFYFSITNYASIDINFVGSKPPLTVGEALIANFVLKDYNGGLVSDDYNIALKLVDSNGTIVKDLNRFVPKKSDANRTVDYNFGFLSSPGVYTIIVDNGVKGFNIPVIAYNLFVNSFNSITGEPQKTFAAGQDANIKVFLSTTSGTPITSASVTGTIRRPNSVSSSTVAFTQSGGYFAAQITDLNTQGDYIIQLTAIANGYTQIEKLKLSVQSYSMTLQPQKNSSAGKKERLKGVYSTSSQAVLEAGIIDLNSAAELTGGTLDSACDANKLSLLVYSAGSSVGSAVTFDVNNDNDAFCDINFGTPAVPGDYYYSLLGIDINISNTSQNLSASTGLKVQNNTIFFDAVDPAAYAQDPYNSWKFTFYEDENVGFKVNVIDLNIDSDSNVSAVTSAKIMQSSTQIDINSDYLDYNIDTGVLTLLAGALVNNNVSAGFVPIEFTVNIDSNIDALDVNGITGFGAFRFKKMNIVSSPADGNGNDKTTMFGPPVFHSNDENVYLSVRVTNAGGTAIKYANIELYSLTNADDWNSISVGPINSRSDNNNLLTNTNGAALLSLGTLPSGVYFGQVKVTNGSTEDYGDFFLMVKSYMVFAQPIMLEETPEGTMCQFLDSTASTSDVNMIVLAMDPSGSMPTPISDYIPDENQTKVYLMSFGEEFKKPTEYASTITVTDINCWGVMGPPGLTQLYPMLTIQPASAWTSGSYRVLIKGSSDTNGAETGDGFFRVQPFRFSVIPVSISETREEKNLSATPGSSFDFNVFSSKDVTLRAELVNDKTQQDINSNLGFDSNNVIVADEMTTVSVQIPSNIDLAEYNMIIHAQAFSGGDEAEQDLFLSMSLFAIIVPNTVGQQAFRYQTSNTGAYDTNILDDAETGMLSQWNGHDCNGNVVVGDIPYNRWVMAGTEWAQNDFNRLILVSTTDQNIWIDYDGDCNFLNETGNNRHVGDTNAGVLVDGNLAVITDVSSLEVKYLKKPADYSGGGFMGGNWAGQYPVDENIGVPIIITQLDGTPVPDVNVVVNRALLISGFGMGVPTEVTPDAWSAVQGTTDANGLARLVLNIEKPGQYMLEIRVNGASGTQLFKPWQGIVIEAKKYTSELYLINPVGDIIIDYNIMMSDANILVDMDSTYYDTNYGLFSESDRNFDLDKDGLTDKNFYFVRLTDAFHTANPWIDANIIVDDDNRMCKPLWMSNPMDNNTDICSDGYSGDEGGALNEAWILNNWGASLCPYSADPQAQMNVSCGNREATYVISENDTNAIDNNVVLINRTTWRALDNTGSNWALWTTKATADANVWGWLNLKGLDNVRTSDSGTLNAKVYRTNARPAPGVQLMMIPIGGSISGTITSGVGRMNLGNLGDSNYMVGIDINMNNNLQTEYQNFEVRTS
jgi:hypothetical protein